MSLFIPETPEQSSEEDEEEKDVSILSPRTRRLFEPEEVMSDSDITSADEEYDNANILEVDTEDNEEPQNQQQNTFNVPDLVVAVQHLLNEQANGQIRSSTVHRIAQYTNDIQLATRESIALYDQLNTQMDECEKQLDFVTRQLEQSKRRNARERRREARAYNALDQRLTDENLNYRMCEEELEEFLRARRR